MGTYDDLELPLVVTAKLSKELDSIFLLYNNLIKNILTQELSATALDGVHEQHPLMTPKIAGQAFDVDYDKISRFLNKTHANKNQDCCQTLPEPPKVRLKIGIIFA